MTFLGIFSTRGEKYYFCVEGSTRGEIETNIGKLGTQKNLNFFFGWRRVLVGVAGCGGCGLDYRGRVWGCGLDHWGRVWGSRLDHGAGCGGLD